MKIHNINTPYVNEDNNCLYSAIGNVLSWYELDKKFIDIIFSGQLDFYYSKQTGSSLVNFKVIEDFPVNFILDKYSLEERMKKLLEPYGISANWVESDNYDESWKELCEINKQKPIILFADHYYLDYHEAYMKSHGAHFFTMLGHKDYDAYVLDSVKLFDYEGVIKKEILKVARVMESELCKINNAWMKIEIKNKNFILDSRCINRVFKRIVYNMLVRKGQNNSFWGLEAMDVFMKDIDKMVSEGSSYKELLESDPRLEKSFENLFVSILRVSQQRSGFAKFLDMLIANNLVSKSDEVETLSMEYKKLHDMWIAVRNQIYLAHRKQSTKNMKNALSYLSNIIIKETKNINKLAEMIQL